ncbi:MAG: SulP family inorganic anion transporter [Bacteroidota bacterium]
MDQNNKIPTGIFSNLKNDLPASVVVFLVAVPLCLGIALASGAPLFSGIIAGIVGGIVVGALSGSQLGVSGPAAGLAAIVLVAIQDLGAFEVFLVAVVLAGIIQVILGFLKAGIIGYYFPTSVIKGMLSGIGIFIILKQVQFALGADAVEGHNVFTQIPYFFDTLTLGAVVITVISILVLILWEQPFMKKQRIFQIIQGPLVVVALGILFNLLFGKAGGLSLEAKHLVSIPVPDNITGFFSQFTFPDFSQITNPQVYMTAGVIALVASLETLLCLEATDKLDPYKRVAPANQELLAQGVGNMMSGLIGGLPITQVIVRSSTNIQSGGRTKASAIVHGILLLLCAMAIPNILNLIPLASLAAILFLVGYKLAKPALFKSMYNLGWTHFIPFMITILGIVFADLLIGIGLGMAVAIFFILYSNYKKPYFFEAEEHEPGKPIRLELSEHVSFLNKAAILQTLNHIPQGSEVIIDASKSIDIDQDVVEIISDFKESAPSKDIRVKVLGQRLNNKKESEVKKFQKAVLDSSLQP